MVGSGRGKQKGMPLTCCRHVNIKSPNKAAAIQTEGSLWICRRGLFQRRLRSSPPSPLFSGHCSPHSFILATFILFLSFMKLSLSLSLALWAALSSAHKLTVKKVQSSQPLARRSAYNSPSGLQLSVDAEDEKNSFDIKCVDTDLLPHSCC